MTTAHDIHALGFAARTADDAAPRGPVDSWLLGVVLLLVVSGEIVVFNTTYFHAAERYGDAYLFVRKHTLALLIGSVACLAAVCLPSTVYRRLAYPALVVAVAGLGLVLLPGIGHGPVRRWLSLGGFNFQPSEFAKWAVIVYLAYALTQKADRLHSFADGLLPPLLVAGGVALLVGVAPDLGSAVYVGVLVLALLFAAGARFLHIAGVLVAGLLLVGVGVLTASYRAARLSTFLNQGADVQGAGYSCTNRCSPSAPADSPASGSARDIRRCSICPRRTPTSSSPWWVRKPACGARPACCSCSRCSACADCGSRCVTRPGSGACWPSAVLS